MESKEILYILGLVIPVLSGISIAYLSDAQVFQIYPDYDIKLLVENTDNFTNKILLIENIEKVQAKDVKIFVNSDWNLNKDYDKCVEGIFPVQSTDQVFQIELPRMSSNVPCNVMFVDYNNGNITSIVITSDSTPGKIYYPETLLTDNGAITLSLLPSIFAENIKTIILFEEKDIGFSKYVGLLIIMLIVYTVGLAVAFIYRQSKKERIKNELNEMKNEVGKQIQRSEDRLDFYEENSILDSTLLERHYRDIEILKRDIISDGVHLDNIKSKIYYRPLGHNAIDELFEKWQYLENMLMSYSFEKEISLRKSSPDGLFYSVMDKMKMPSKFGHKFVEIYQFRNRLTHGQEKNTFHIKENVKKIDKFIYDIEDFLKQKQ